MSKHKTPRLVSLAILVSVCILMMGFLIPACGSGDPIVRITLLHLNDVYEITPVGNGQSGGLARVATIRRQLLDQNPNTFTILAGDLFSPSALGTARVNGKPLAGEQIVDVMNAVGLDYMTFGNHEFDLKEEAFLQRLSEAKFTLFSANAFNAQGQSFTGVSKNAFITLDNNGGPPVTIGMIGLIMDSFGAPDYADIRDPVGTAREQVAELAGKVDILVAVTHLPMAQDQELAIGLPAIDLILGGHEHENIQAWRGEDFTPIFKADANARTVYIHDLAYNTNNKTLEIESRLRLVTGEINQDPEVKSVVDKWVAQASDAFRSDGFNPEKSVAILPYALDGLEASVRNRPTNLTDLIAAGMLAESPDAQLAIFNSGSVRIDDKLPPGNITEYDVIRIMPFGGKVQTVEISGEILDRVLKQGQANKGSGGYLQTVNVEMKDDGWLIKGQPLEPGAKYPVAMNDFLLTGREKGLKFLNPNTAGITVIEDGVDLRRALINQLTRQFAGS